MRFFTLVLLAVVGIAVAVPMEQDGNGINIAIRGPSRPEIERPHHTHGY
jgi:hypothetical protein